MCCASVSGGTCSHCAAAVNADDETREIPKYKPTKWLVSIGLCIFSLFQSKNLPDCSSFHIVVHPDFELWPQSWIQFTPRSFGVGHKENAVIRWKAHSFLPMPNPPATAVLRFPPQSRKTRPHFLSTNTSSSFFGSPIFSPARPFAAATSWSSQPQTWISEQPTPTRPVARSRRRLLSPASAQ